MHLTSNDLQDQQPIPETFAFGRPANDEPMALSDNVSPHLSWDGFPSEARSFVLICMDPDVPSVADDVNQPGRVISESLPRVDFCHWVMIDIPTEITELATGACSNGVTVGGKTQPSGPQDTRQGLNDYTQFMAGNPEMAGQYFGYDGPCPPWNDERLHHYIFTIYALDIDHLALPEPFTGHQALEAMSGHILDQASLCGTYTLYQK